MTRPKKIPAQVFVGPSGNGDDPAVMAERLLTLKAEPHEIVWLVEWQSRATGRAELAWAGRWEPDHNAGIWFSQEAAESAAEHRHKELANEAYLYHFRVAPYGRWGGP